MVEVAQRSAESPRRACAESDIGDLQELGTANDDIGTQPELSPAEPSPTGISIRALVPIDPNRDISNLGLLNLNSINTLTASCTYQRALVYFNNYPEHSLMSDHCRALLFTLVRVMRPKVVGEIGTFFVGTSEVLARALWETGGGELHTTDPYGGDRCPAVIGQWPK